MLPRLAYVMFKRQHIGDDAQNTKDNRKSLGRRSQDVVLKDLQWRGDASGVSSGFASKATFHVQQSVLSLPKKSHRAKEMNK